MKRTTCPYAMGIALPLAAVLGEITQRDAQAKPPGYTFTKIATLGDPLPGNSPFVNDFEPGGLNSEGDIAFGADVSIGALGRVCVFGSNDPHDPCEGVFLRPHNGQITELGRTDGAAPGGGTFSSPGFLGPVGLNEPGDVVFDIYLQLSPCRSVST